MNAEDFWARLEYRVCREIDCLRGDEFRALWCDGFISELFEILDDRPVMTGRVWMGRGQKQEQWRFTLFLSENVHGEAEVEWAVILPAEDVTGWLSLDQVHRVMTIVPGAAHPDGRPSTS